MRSWLEECRRRYEPGGIHGLLRKLGITPRRRFNKICMGDFSTPKSLPHYEALLEGAYIVWGALVQANYQAFAAGDADLPGVVAFSPDPDFDHETEELRTIAHRVYELKGTKPRRSLEARAASLISDGYGDYQHERLPDSITGGREVYFSTFFVHRFHLPSGYLIPECFPLLVNPDRSRLVMILPLRYWSDSLIVHWLDVADDARSNDPGTAQGEDLEDEIELVDNDEVRRSYAENPLRLRSAAAAKVREVIAELELPKRAYIRVSARRKDGFIHRDLVFADDPIDRKHDIRMTGPGFDVVTDLGSAPHLQGYILEFKDGLESSGFIFREP